MPSTWDDVRRRRQRRRPEGPVQPGRRDLRRRALPARRRRRQGPLPRDLRLQPRRLVRRVRPHAGARDRRPPGRPRRLAHRPHAGPLPGPGARRPTPARCPTSELKKQFKPGQNAANVVESDANRRAIRIFSRKGAPVVAVNDGKITRIGHTKKLGKFVELQDPYGNTYRYSNLGEIADVYPFPKERKTRHTHELELPKAGAKPKGAASKTTHADVTAAPQPRALDHRARPKQAARRPPRPRSRRRAREGAPLRPPGAPERQGRRRPRPARPRGPVGRRGRRDLRARRPQARPAPLRRQAAAQGRAGGRRHRARPHRQAQRRSRPAPALRDPPGRPRRPAHRPEADPRRLEAARVHRDLPLQEEEPVLRRGRGGALDRPDHAHEQGGAPAPRAQQPEHRRLRVRPGGHPLPARSTAASSPRSSSSPPPASSRR